MGTVTPWEIKGEIDYDKLIREFGLKSMPKLPTSFTDHVLFRRGMVYAQRDFEVILETIKKKKKFVMMTGLMPSGKFHFGHKMVADQIIHYQKLGAKVYVTVADIEAYNSRNSDMKELHRVAIEEYLTNYVALGMDLKKCDFYFQSKRSKDGSKASAYYSLSKMFGRHTTFNQVKAAYGDISPAKLSASLLQASDMYHAQLPEFEGGPTPTIIPVGADQDPHIRLARDMAKKYKLHKFVPISSTAHTFMPGLKGGKMSSSDSTSYLALTDSTKDAKKKINKYAFSGGQVTVADHRKLGGNPDIDVSFQMLRYGLEPNDKKLDEIYASYKSGELLSGELKAITIEKVQNFLDFHHKAREKATSKVKNFLS
jgi:tryptophanyl-tRNA synthetase